VPTDGVVDQDCGGSSGSDIQAVDSSRTNDAAWRAAWPELPASVLFLGEDVFGNQVSVVSGHANAQMWLHEDGSWVDLELPAGELVEAIAGHGSDWLDVYTDGELEAARRFRTATAIDLDCHLHWVTPRFLGGRCAAHNLALMERHRHLAAHGSPWAQVRLLPPGAEAAWV